MVASIIDTNYKMKVDFNNMKHCDVFEICRSYTPKVKSEIIRMSSNSHQFIPHNITEKGRLKIK